ncbi:radical SAM/SPASM domain-containing protein [Malaciobacter halophilus]|uniref:radical SAM/SPASM domain-containing protein n=1 Tax=Malaciobacter halophilus TaxID=197482 RepID=UPI002244F6C6|nr:SPASM domain-containing protein [Malaciobacter halophilus]
MTNICNLKCSFCPPKIKPNMTMDLQTFDKINSQLQNYTKELAYHVVGDPLVLSNLNEYLNISKKYSLKVNITTTANNINKKHYDALTNSILKQINFSINSYNANSHKKSLDNYLQGIIDFIKYAQSLTHEYFINLRIWNLDDTKSAKDFNQQVFKKIGEEFNCKLDIDEIYRLKPKNIRIGRKLFFNFDDYFKWPSLQEQTISKKGFCYGLDSHFAILSNADVVPCCLDQNAIINLGNIKEKNIKDILKSKRVLDIQKGFKQNILVEELCQKCDYRRRFDKENK